MPAQANGSGKTGVLEMKDGETFLFTSESVGEGHPGLFFYIYKVRCFLSRCTSYDFCSLTQESRQVHQSLLSCVYFCYVQLSKLLRSTFEENWGQFESSTLTFLNAKSNFIFL